LDVDEPGGTHTDVYGHIFYILAVHISLPDPSRPITRHVHTSTNTRQMMHWTGRVSVNTLVEGICAIHMASYVSAPYKDRGGLMLVGPPGVLKTTLLDVLDDNYHNALSISNSFMGTMKNLQSAFYNGQVRSLCFPDLQSIYAGDPRTAGRIEQMMMQLSGEATRTIGGDSDARYAKFKGYCTIFACMTDTFFASRAAKWEGSGFLRRFLWSSYTLADPEILIRAITQWTRADLGAYRIPEIPTNIYIKENLTHTERREVLSWLRHQPVPHEIQYQVMCKAICALRWHYERIGYKRDAMQTMHEFSETLQRDAALLVIPEQKYDREEAKFENQNHKRERRIHRSRNGAAKTH
jgi:hypothetical protein